MEKKKRHSLIKLGKCLYKCTRCGLTVKKDSTVDSGQILTDKFGVVLTENLGCIEINNEYEK